MLLIKYREDSSCGFTNVKMEIIEEKESKQELIDKIKDIFDDAIEDDEVEFINSYEKEELDESDEFDDDYLILQYYPDIVDSKDVYCIVE